MYIWDPEILPLPSVKFGVSNKNSTIRKKLENGQTFSRRRYSKELELLTFTFLFNAAEYKIFKATWLHRLTSGVDYFTIPLPNGNLDDEDNLQPTVVKFTSDYSASHKGYGNWTVTATAEVKDKQVMSELDLSLLESSGGTSIVPYPDRGVTIWLWDNDNSQRVYIKSSTNYTAVRYWDGSEEVISNNSYFSPVLPTYQQDIEYRCEFWACSSASDLTPSGFIQEVGDTRSATSPTSSLSSSFRRVDLLRTQNLEKFYTFFSNKLISKEQNTSLTIPVDYSLDNFSLSSSDTITDLIMDGSNIGVSNSLFNILSCDNIKTINFLNPYIVSDFEINNVPLQGNLDLTNVIVDPTAKVFRIRSCNLLQTIQIPAPLRVDAFELSYLPNLSSIELPMVTEINASFTLSNLSLVGEIDLSNALISGSFSQTSCNLISGLKLPGIQNSATITQCNSLNTIEFIGSSSTYISLVLTNLPVLNNIITPPGFKTSILQINTTRLNGHLDMSEGDNRPGSSAQQITFSNNTMLQELSLPTTYTTGRLSVSNNAMLSTLNMQGDSKYDTITIGYNNLLKNLNTTGDVETSTCTISNNGVEDLDVSFINYKVGDTGNYLHIYNNNDLKTLKMGGGVLSYIILRGNSLESVDISEPCTVTYARFYDSKYPQHLDLTNLNINYTSGVYGLTIEDTTNLTEVTINSITVKRLWIDSTDIETLNILGTITSQSDCTVTNNNLSVAAIKDLVFNLQPLSGSIKLKISGNPAWVGGALDPSDPDTPATLAEAASRNINITA